MFPISVNDVPGWLVTIPPSAIGVPVAATPGLVPHCDVLTAAAPDEAGAVVVAGVLADLVLLHAARPIIPIAATSAPTARTRGTYWYIVIDTHLPAVSSGDPFVPAPPAAATVRCYTKSALFTGRPC